MRILYFVILSAASLLVLAGGGLADELAGTCSDVVKTVSKEEGTSDFYFGRCNALEGVPCAKESQKILKARWRHAGTYKWESALTNDTLYYWHYNIKPGNVYSFEHQYQYSCWNNTTASEHTEWQRPLNFTLAVLDLQLVIVNGSGDVDAGQSLELLCTSGVSLGSETLIEFSLGNQVAICRPNSQESRLFRNGWMVHRVNHTGDCIVKKLSVDTADSGAYHCTASIPDSNTHIVSSPVTINVHARATSTNSKGLETVYIVIVGVASVVVVVLAMFVLFVVCYKKRQRKATYEVTNPLHGNPGSNNHTPDNASVQETSLVQLQTTAELHPSEPGEASDIYSSSPYDGTLMHLSSFGSGQLLSTESQDLRRSPTSGQRSSNPARRSVKSWDIEKREKKEQKKRNSDKYGV